MSHQQQPGKHGPSVPEAQPILHQRSREIQPYGTLVEYPIDVSEAAKKKSVEELNQVLADTIYLREMFKKAHWQVSGPTFYQLHLLFDKFFDEQNELVDFLGERVQTLGGIALVMPHDVARVTRIEAPPTGREEVPVILSRLVDGLETVIKASRAAARRALTDGDETTADILVANVIRTDEKQVWFLSEHLVDTPLVSAK
jgi:starvation-inducible DNA-binding protein